MDYSGDGPRPSSSTSAASSLASMTSSDTSFSTNTASSEHAMIGSSQAGWSKDTLSHRPTYRTPSSSDDHQTFKSLQQPFLPSNHSVGQVPPLHVGERRPSSPFPTSKTPTSTSFLRRDSESVRPTSHDALSHTSVSQPTLHRSTSRSNLDISDRYWQQDGQAKHPSSPTTYSAHRDLFSITSTGRGDRLISQPVSTMPFRRVYKDYSQTHQVEQGANTSPRRNLSSSNTQPVYNPYFPLQQIDPSSTPASASSTRLPSHGLSLSPDSHTDRTRTPGLSSTSRVSCKSNSRSPGILGLPRQDLPVQTARSPASQSFIASRSSMAPNTEYRPQYDLEVKVN